jgi:hypothetical protein
MNQPDLTERHAALTDVQKAILTLLALVGATPGKTRLVNYLREARIKSPAGSAYTNPTLDPTLTELLHMGLIEQVAGGDFRCHPTVQTLALQCQGRRNWALCAAVDQVSASTASATINASNYETLVLLRMAMLVGRTYRGPLFSRVRQTL